MTFLENIHSQLGSFYTLKISLYLAVVSDVQLVKETVYDVEIIEIESFQDKRVYF